MTDLPRRYVGIDLHRRRSVIVKMTEDGTVLETTRVDNDPLQFLHAVTTGGEDLEVALEATYGWYWAADLLQAEGAKVHLVHPLGLHWDNRRVKNDERDATELANRLRHSDLPEAWVATPEFRELRELVRYRHLSRCLHKKRYAEDRIMPRSSAGDAWEAVLATRTSA